MAENSVLLSKYILHVFGRCLGKFPESLKEEIERVQKRTLYALYIPIYHIVHAALLETSILSLPQRRKVLCKSYFEKLIHPEDKLNELIPKKRESLCSYNLRNDNRLIIIFFHNNTTRFHNTGPRSSKNPQVRRRMQRG